MSKAENLGQHKGPLWDVWGGCLQGRLVVEKATRRNGVIIDTLDPTLSGVETPLYNVLLEGEADGSSGSRLYSSTSFCQHFELLQEFGSHEWVLPAIRRAQQASWQLPEGVSLGGYCQQLVGSSGEQQQQLPPLPSAPPAAAVSHQLAGAAAGPTGEGVSLPAQEWAMVGQFYKPALSQPSHTGAASGQQGGQQGGPGPQRAAGDEARSGLPPAPAGAAAAAARRSGRAQQPAGAGAGAGGKRRRAAAEAEGSAAAAAAGEGGGGGGVVRPRQRTRLGRAQEGASKPPPELGPAAQLPPAMPARVRDLQQEEAAAAAPAAAASHPSSISSQQAEQMAAAAAAGAASSLPPQRKRTSHLKAATASDSSKQQDSRRRPSRQASGAKPPAKGKSKARPQAAGAILEERGEWLKIWTGHWIPRVQLHTPGDLRLGEESAAGDAPGEYEVERIVDCMPLAGKARGRRYLVKWVGYALDLGSRAGGGHWEGEGSVRRCEAYAHWRRDMEQGRLAYLTAGPPPAGEA